MERAPVTRRLLARALVVDAATRPLNIAVAVGVVVAAAVLGAWWLLPIGLVVYVGMVGATLFDGDRAERVGRKTYERKRAERRPKEDGLPALAPPVTEKLALARVEEQRIRKAIEEAPLPMQDVGEEVERLMQALDNLAVRADTVYGYLQNEDAGAIEERVARLRGASSDDSAVSAMNEQAAVALEDQLTAIKQLQRQLSRFDAQMEHIAATLGAIHAQIVRMSVEEEAAAQGRVAEQVRDLRREVGAAADALQEAYGELG
jgi:hypothetical protein